MTRESPIKKEDAIGEGPIIHSPRKTSLGRADEFFTELEGILSDPGGIVPSLEKSDAFLQRLDTFTSEIERLLQSPIDFREVSR